MTTIPLPEPDENSFHWNVQNELKKIAHETGLSVEHVQSVCVLFGLPKFRGTAAEIKRILNGYVEM